MFPITSKYFYHPCVLTHQHMLEVQLSFEPFSLQVPRATEGTQTLSSCSAPGAVASHLANLHKCIKHLLCDYHLWHMDMSGQLPCHLSMEKLIGVMLKRGRNTEESAGMKGGWAGRHERRGTRPEWEVYTHEKREMGEKDEKEKLSPHQIYNKITALGDSLL